MRRELAFIVAVLMLAGCGADSLTQNTGNVPVDQTANAVKRVGIACDSYSSSLTTLAAMNHQGQLSAATVERVDEIVVVVGPFCRPGAQPTGMDTQDILTTIEPLVYELLLARQ